MSNISVFKRVFVLHVLFVFHLRKISMRTATYYFDDYEGVGRKFDGIGGLSGGGATSKLLVNYPAKQRNEILDYLFKPHFGASLQILKVEIGGDVQSTDGTEASHMHNSWDENYHRGYEWWLMTEAKKRNPSIKLCGLPWGFPGWIGQGSQNPYRNPTLTASYIIRWINGAKVHHNLTIDYIGVWNEKDYNITYIKTLRRMLDELGFSHVRIVAADGGWNIAEDILTDPDLDSAVDVIGVHYPGTLTTKDALSTGKQLWSSEDYSTFNDDNGGGCWARIINQNYAVGHMTSTISWNLVASYYRGLPFYRDGLMTASEPWSGYYSVNPPIWLTAHTTQFTAIGWTYLQHGRGVGLLDGGGSHVALTSPDRRHLTVVMETMTHNHSICIRPALPVYQVQKQTVRISLKGSFAGISRMSVWHSKLGLNSTNTTLFRKKDPLVFTDGLAVMSLDLDEVYTLTTLDAGRKGRHRAPPPSQRFPLPYSDSFEDYMLNEEPANLAQQTGAYEVTSDPMLPGNKVIRQMVLETPVSWCQADMVDKSASFIGDPDWKNIYVSVDASLESANRTDGLFVAARVQNGGCSTFIAHGIFFFVFPENGTFDVTYDLARSISITSGMLDFSVAGRITLALIVQGLSCRGLVNGHQAFRAELSPIIDKGFVAIGTNSYGIADFDNLHIDSVHDGVDVMREERKPSWLRKSGVLYFELAP